MAKSLSFRKKQEPNTIPERVLTNSFVPGAPSVNIIPSDVLTHYEDNKVRSRFIVASGIIVSLGLLGILGSTLSVSNTEKQLSALQEESRVLSSETAQLAPGKQYIDALESKRAVLAEKVSRDIAHSAIMGELNKISNSTNSTISSFSVTPLIEIGEGGGQAADCPSPDPFGATEGIACISFTIDSESGNDANNFSSALNKSDLFSSVFIQSLNTTSENAVMQGSVLANTNALNDRFLDINQSVHDLLAEAAPTAVNTPDDNENIVSDEEVAAQNMHEESENE